MKLLSKSLFNVFTTTQCSHTIQHIDGSIYTESLHGGSSYIHVDITE